MSQIIPGTVLKCPFLKWKAYKNTPFAKERGIRLLGCNVEVIVRGLSEVYEEWIRNIPDILHRMIGVNRKDEISAGGVNDTYIADVVHHTVTREYKSMLVRNKGPIWDTTLN